jgi:hypothetical protein
VELTSTHGCVLTIGYSELRNRKQAQLTEEWDLWESAERERAILRSVIYVVVLLMTLFTAFLNLIYGVTFTRSQNLAWITSVFMGCFTGESPPCVRLWRHSVDSCRCCCFAVCAAVAAAVAVVSGGAGGVPAVVPSSLPMFTLSPWYLMQMSCWWSR